jgi:adenosylhomocysteine nucleosidase
MHLGIVVAMPMEGRSLTRTPLQRGQALRIDQSCSVVQAGIGGANAQRATRALYESGVDALISWGCAGGLCPAIRAGTLSIPDAVVDFDGEQLPIDRRLHQSLCHLLADTALIRTERSLSYDSAVVSTQQKAALYQRYGAIAVDMESAAVALTAHGYGLPFASVRAILDPADQALPETAVQGLDDDGTFVMSCGLRSLLKKPGDITGLARLALNSYRAGKSLQRAAQRLRTNELD